jgi:hypothetical protein
VDCEVAHRNGVSLRGTGRSFCFDGVAAGPAGSAVPHAPSFCLQSAGLPSCCTASFRTVKWMGLAAQDGRSLGPQVSKQLQCGLTKPGSRAGSHIDTRRHHPTFTYASIAVLRARPCISLRRSLRGAGSGEGSISSAHSNATCFPDNYRLTLGTSIDGTRHAGRSSKYTHYVRKTTKQTGYASALYAADSRSTHMPSTWPSPKGRTWEQMMPATPFARSHHQ